MEKKDLREQLPTLNNSAAAIAAGMRIGELEALAVHELNGVPHVLLPEGRELRRMDHLAARPYRLKFSREFNEPASFCAFAQEMDLKENGRLYGNAEDTRIWARFADVRPGEPSWEDQWANLSLPFSPELTAWQEKSGTSLDQLEFVEFLEEMIHTIAEPSGADITTAYRAFQAARNVKVTQVIQDGGDMQVALEEEVRGTLRNNNVSVPSNLTLCLRVFAMGKSYPVDAIVNYRLQNDSIKFIFKLLRLPELIEDAFNDVRQEVEEALGMKVLF